MRRSLAAACALCCGAFAQERGRLLSVRAGGDAAESFVELVGDRPLTFTTLKLRSPPRVVVDFAETDLALPVRDLAVDDGTIRRVAAAPAGQKTARVVIELAGDAEFAVRAHGSTIEVRVPRIAPLLAKAEPPRAPAAGPSPEQAASPAGRSAETPPAATAELPPPAGGPGEAPPVAAAAPPPPAGSRNQASPAAPSAEGASAPAAEARRTAAPGTAPQPADAAPPAPPGGGQAALRAGPAASQSEAQKRASLPTVALVGSRATPPAAEKTDGRAAGESPAAARKAVRERRPAAVEKAPAGRKPGAAAPRHSITGIGFRPVGDGEVIVRSDHPLEVGVSADGNAVVLHLASAGIPLPNNRRPLDTQYFNGPVLRVVPLAVASGTEIRIELREHADYQLAQSGGVLTVTFSVPR